MWVKLNGKFFFRLYFLLNIDYKYRVVKKSLCTWQLQLKVAQKLFDHPVQLNNQTAYTPRVTTLKNL